MYNPQIHYRTLFSIRRSEASDFNHIYEAIIRHIRSWLKTHALTKHQKNDFQKTWFFSGGKLPATKENYRVEVRTEGYDFEKKIADHWVIRFEHTDSAYKMRKWRTDISITCHDYNNAEVYVTVTWFLNKNYFGETPPLPPSSVPRIVSNILSDEMLYCNINGKRINPIANNLRPGDGREMFKFINSPERIVPVVLINIKHYQTLLNPDGLQKLLLGSGVVYWYNELSIHEELAFEWGAKISEFYQCGPDAIRVYLPNPNFQNEFDFKRHRYFPLSQYSENIENLINTLSQSVFRISSGNLLDDVVTNFETLYIFQQKNRLLKLKEAANKNSLTAEEQEYILALEDENVKLSREKHELTEMLSNESENASFLEMEKQDLKEKFTILQKQYNDLGKLEGTYQQAITSHLDEIGIFEKLPINLEEALKLISKLFKNQIVVLNAAYESAMVASFKDIPAAYELMYAMGTLLYNLYFSKDCGGDIEKEFKNSGFDVSLKESSMTNNDNALIALRKRVYNGKEYTFSPHTKLEKGGKSLRIYYIADNEKRVLVIGHCGDHLKTAGTARRKEG